MDESIRKLVKNRPWRCHLAMPFRLLIHAGESQKCLDTWDGAVPDDMPYGAILGQVKVAACIRPRDIASPFSGRWDYLANHPHVEGPFCLVLQQALRFKRPIPCRGPQGFFDFPLPVNH